MLIPNTTTLANWKNNFLFFIYKYIGLFNLNQFKKIWFQGYLNQLRNLQKVENCRIFSHMIFYFWNWNPQFCICQKTIVVFQVLKNSVHGSLTPIYWTRYGNFLILLQWGKTVCIMEKDCCKDNKIQQNFPIKSNYEL